MHTITSFHPFSGFLIYDYLHQQLHDGYYETSAKKFAVHDLLCEIQTALNEKGKTNADYGIPCADI